MTNMYHRIIKRLLDCIISCLGITILFPVLMIVALLIYIEDGAPVFFTHKRVGLSGKPFTIYKFRSMYKNSKLQPSSDANSSSITHIGKIIRRTNIDELPQLFNVVTGQMSIIGPRPALLSQTELNKLRLEKGIYKLLPGITGLAQVNSYDGMKDEVKVDFDEHYLKSLSFLLDLKIVILTVLYFFRKQPKY